MLRELIYTVVVCHFSEILRMRCTDCWFEKKNYDRFLFYHSIFQISEKEDNLARYTQIFSRKFSFFSILLSESLESLVE